MRRLYLLPILLFFVLILPGTALAQPDDTIKVDTSVVRLNIGVVDPGFEGPISSTLINFGRETCVVAKGIPFLRVSFHRCPQSAKARSSVKYDRETYLNGVKKDVLAYSALTFLNMDAMTAKAAEKAFVSFRKALVLWATLVAVVLALLAIFAPLGR